MFCSALCKRVAEIQYELKSKTLFLTTSETKAGEVIFNSLVKISMTSFEGRIEQE